MGKQANRKFIMIWGLIALAGIIFIITGSSLAGSNNFSSDEGDCGPLAQEAEAGNLHGAMQVGTENGISFVFSPAEEDNQKESPQPDNRGDYCVSVAQSGTYALTGVASADHMGQDSIWVVLNGQSFLWDIGFGEGFQERPINDRQNEGAPVEIELAAGQYVISFHQREAGAKLDRFELVPTSFEPEPTEETSNENIGLEIPGGSAICGPLRQEAEHATLFGQMGIRERQDASGGKYIDVPAEVGQVSTPQDSGHRAEFCVSVPVDGNYQIKAQADAPDTNSDSMWVTVDGAPSQGYLWQPREGNGFVEDLVHDRGVNDVQIIYLTKGDHKITFHHREPNTKLDWFEVEAVPGQGQPIEPTEPTATSIPAEPTATSVPVEPTATAVPPTATSIPPTATPIAECNSLLLEAESGTLHGAFAIGEDDQASGGKYIYIPNDIGNAPNSTIDRDNRVDFCVLVPHTGDYQIMAWAKAPDAQHDSFYVTVDGGPANGFVWDVKLGNNFGNSYVGDRGKTDRVTLNLSEGKHIVSFHRREAGTLLDSFELIPLSNGGGGGSIDPTPTVEPTQVPTEVPATSVPTSVPTQVPTNAPTQAPTLVAPQPTENATGGSCANSLIFEAESGSLTGSFIIGYNKGASGGQYIEIPEKAGHAPNRKIDFKSSASFCVNIKTAGTYQVLARSWAADIHHDSFFVQIDNAPAAGYVWDVKNGQSFINDLVNDRGKTDPTTFYLSEGSHTITFYRREASTKLDKFEFVNIDDSGTVIEPTPTQSAPTATNVPPTATATQRPATATPVPPTATNIPATATATGVPATATPVVVPPTATPNPAGNGAIAAKLLYPTDISFNSTDWYGNPYDLIAVAIFTHHGTGLKRRTEMFYNGDDVWTARFTPDRTGKWTYSTQSSNSDLNNKSGTIQVETSSGKGFVQASGDKWIRSATGEAFVPQFIMLDELDQFHNNSGRINSDLNSFMGDHGFNGVHIRGYCRWFLLEADQCNYIQSDQRNPDPRTFEAVEQIILETYRRGGTTHIWMYGDSSRNQNPTAWGLNGIEDQRLQRYLAARLGALPGWTMGYGYDVSEWASPAQINQWYSYIDSRMMYPHLMSARGDKNQIMQHSESMSYASYEQQRPDYNGYVEAINARPGKPAFSEDRFRVRNEGRSKDYSLDDTRQGLWRSGMAGGVANIWGYLLEGGSNSAGSRSYPNKSQIKLYFTFFESRFTKDVSRCNDLTNGSCLKRPTNQHFIFYTENASSIELNLSSMTGSQPFVAVNTKTGQQINGTFQPNQQTWQAPTQSDWAIAVGNW